MHHHQRTSTNVYRHTRQPEWVATVCRGPVLTQLSFSDRTFGSRQSALHAAQAWLRLARQLSLDAKIIVPNEATRHSTGWEHIDRLEVTINNQPNQPAYSVIYLQHAPGGTLRPRQKYFAHADYSDSFTALRAAIAFVAKCKSNQKTIGTYP